MLPLFCDYSLQQAYELHLTQVVGLLTIWVQWTHQRAVWMDDWKTYYQASCRGDKPTGTTKPANANPESSMVFFVKLTSYKFRRKSPSIELQIWKQETLLDDILRPLKKAIKEWDSWTAKLSDFGIEHMRKQVAISQSVILRCRNHAKGNHKISKWILCWEKAEEWWREKMAIHGPIAIINLR